MSNSDRPSGFTPRRHAFGGVIRANAYAIASAYATSIFNGDAVVLTAGKVNQAADNSAAILGIFAGCQYVDSEGNVKFARHWTADAVTLGSADAKAWVYDDPGIIFGVQTDSATAYVDATHKGGSYDVQLTHAGSTYTGQSGMELDLNDAGSTQFLVLGLIDEPNNAAGVNAKIEVMIRKALLNQS